MIIEQDKLENSTSDIESYFDDIIKRIEKIEGDIACSQDWMRRWKDSSEKEELVDHHLEITYELLDDINTLQSIILSLGIKMGENYEIKK